MIAKIEDVKNGNVLWYVTIYEVRGLKKGFVESLEIVGEPFAGKYVESFFL